MTAQNFNSVPVFAIWTPYRNVYASILDLCNSVDELNAKIDQTKTELEAKIDQTKTELETKIDQTKTEFKTDIENMKQDIIAALAALRNRQGATVLSSLGRLCAKTIAIGRQVL